MEHPKLFISYSWTNTDHINWVVNLATELTESGVDVILDKWCLREGHDTNEFMENMVNDPDIKKVILICDKVYAEKANKRSGGVGTEAQIISSKIYEKHDQEKFVAIVKERDEQGEAYLPTYYGSRIYIDFSDQDKESSNFEELLRWIYDKPLFKKPEIGNKPAFLEDENISLSLGTSVHFRRAIDALRNNKQYCEAAVKEYLTVLSKRMENLRIENTEGEFDDKVLESITQFIPYRNETIELFLTLANYRDTDESRRTLHRFFESVLHYFRKPDNISRYREWDFDNFKFIIHELFLYAIASLIKHERFESASYLMKYEYYNLGNSEYGRDNMVQFGVFHQYLSSFKYRNDRLKLNRLSLRADLLKERCKNLGIEFRHLMQADFILFLRDCLDHPEISFHWFPETLLFIGYPSAAFEVFARSKSTSYFEQSKQLLGINSLDDLSPLIQAFSDGKYTIPRWEHSSFNPFDLMGIKELATKP